MKIAKNEYAKKWQFCIFIATIALIISILGFFFNRKHLSDATANPTSSVPTLLQKLDKTNEIHVGYGVYPPYTMEDPNTKEVSGFSIDIINIIAKELNAEVIWHRLNWNTMSADLKRGSYDIIADPIFQTIPRAREFSFTEPYAFFAEGIGVVRIDDNRFKDFKDIDKEGITIAVGQGWSSETFVQSNVSKAKVKPIQTTNDLLQIFNEVTSGRVDIAIADGADAIRFVEEHSNKVKILWIDSPPAYVPAGFALRTTDKESTEFITVCLRSLKYLGVIDGLAKKYDIDNIVKANE